MADVKLAATREAYGPTLVELVKEGLDVVALDADLSKSTTSAKFAKAYPDRFFQAGIAEQNMVGLAAGLAMAGKVAFCSSFACFLTNRAVDQIRVSVCYANLDVKVVVTHGGISVGEDGASHQAMEEIAYMRAIPNMRVMVPCDVVEAERCVRVAAKTPGPFMIRLGRAKQRTITTDETPFELGKGIVWREGTDVALAATGLMVQRCLAAAEILATKGVSARVLGFHTVDPIDTELLAKAASECGCVLTAEEHQIDGGFGSAVAQSLVETVPVPMKLIGMPNKFGAAGDGDPLISHFHMDPPDIVAGALELIKRK
jgi:transketolase